MPPTPVPISSRRAQRERGASDVRAVVMVLGTNDCRRRVRPAHGHAAAGSTRPHATPRAEWIPEPVMRSRTSPHSRGPSPRIRGRRRPDRYRSRSRTNSPVPPALYQRHIPRHIDAAKASKGRHMVPAVGAKGARLHAAARRRRHRVACRLQGPQAGALLLSQGRHAGLHQGGDRLQRAASAPSPRPTPTSSGVSADPVQGAGQVPRQARPDDPARLRRRRRKC